MFGKLERGAVRLQPSNAGDRRAASSGNFGSSEVDTSRTCQCVRTTSAFGFIADEICSSRAFQQMTHCGSRTCAEQPLSCRKNSASQNIYCTKPLSR